MKTTPLAIELLRIDGDTQSRVKINEDTVDEYSELITQNGKEWPFPPLDVFHDGTDYFVADGFHRLLAGLRAKRGSVPCNVHKGTAKDARIFGMTANDKHGMRMTPADKRAGVEWLLDTGGKMTQKAIAEAAGVGVRLVRMVVADRNPVSIAGKSNPPKRDGERHDASSPPSGGGKPPEPPQDAPETDGDSEPDSSPETPQTDAQGTEDDMGKCPVCAGVKWTSDEDGLGTMCSKCSHPWGEPAGDPDEDRITTLRQKTVKTAEALIRAFDDLQVVKARAEYDEAILRCKQLLSIAKGWK